LFVFVGFLNKQNSISWTSFVESQASREGNKTCLIAKTNNKSCFITLFS